MDNRTPSDVSELLNDIVDYGSYQTLGNLSVTFDGAGDYRNYTRTLDLDTGVHTSSWSSNGSAFETAVFCSHPALSCVYHLTSNTTLPSVTIALANELMDSSLVNVTCGEGYTRLTGVTEQASIGLKFDALTRVVGNSTSSTCSPDTQSGSLTIPQTSGQTSLALAFTAESDYNQSRGDAAHDYSFRGADPGPAVEARGSSASRQGYEALLRAHVADHAALMGLFTLDLPDTANSSAFETAALVARYDDTNATSTAADPFLESLLFDYARHLLLSSSRPGSLPANLQGRWTEQLDPAWGADYHANINLQMSYWGAEPTGLGGTARPLFAYVADTWAPRGAETARLVYGGEGWVVHDEVNVFGYTGMKNDAQWADCEFLGPPSLLDVCLACLTTWT